MDPYRFGYSPVVERPKLSWPNGARLAVWVCPNIEHYEYLPAEVRVRNPWPRMPHPDVLGYGGRDYGNREGNKVAEWTVTSGERQFHGGGHAVRGVTQGDSDTSLYADAQAAQGAAGAAGAQDKAADDDVVDAEIVDDEKPMGGAA